MRNKTSGTPRSGRRGWRTAVDATARRARLLDHSPRLVEALRRLRERLPGDSDFGDPLSTADRRHLAVAEQRLAMLTHDEPRALREVGLAALQMWQRALDPGRGGHRDELLTIAFTDLVGFSSWALDAGDTDTLRLLREVGSAIESPVTRHGGRVVKRLGDGMMAVFPEAQAAFDAVLEARTELAAVTVAGYRPGLRAALHTGRPRRLGGDYLGVDVNVAARLAQKASADELLASETTVAGLDRKAIDFRRKKTFVFRRVKGVPQELAVYAVRLPAG